MLLQYNLLDNLKGLLWSALFSMSLMIRTFDKCLKILVMLQPN